MGVTYATGAPGGNARWLTISLDTPIFLDPDTLYGFQIVSSGTGGNDEFFMEIDGTANDSYAGGFALTTGDISGESMWDGNDGRPGDRAFVASMTALDSLPPFHPIDAAPEGDETLNPVVLEAEVEDWGTSFSNAVFYLDGMPLENGSSHTVSGVTSLRSGELMLNPGTLHTGKVVVTGLSGGRVTNEWSFSMAPAFQLVQVSPEESGNTTSVVLSAEIGERASTLDAVSLFLDGVPLVLSGSNTVLGVTAIWSDDVVLEPNSTHTGRVVIAGTPIGSTNEWVFSVGQYWTLSNEYYSGESLLNDVVSMRGNSELRLTGESPLSGASINLKSIDSWVFLPWVKPSNVLGKLDRFQVDGAAAVNNENLRVVQYGQGSVVIPHPVDFQPMEVFDGENFSGESLALSPNTAYGAVLGGKVSSFILKRGYTATLAGNPDGSGVSFNYVASDGDLRIGALPAGLNNQVLFIRIFPWHWVAKKGSCDIAPSALEAQWFYNWNVTWQAANPDYEYVAIKQQRWWPGLPDPEGAGYMGVNHVSGYNEPNNSVEDAYESLNNGDVATAVAAWGELEWTGLRIGAPAVTDGGYGWIVDFLNQAEAAGRRVDYIPIHYYRSSKQRSGVCGRCAIQLPEGGV